MEEKRHFEGHHNPPEEPGCGQSSSKPSEQAPSPTRPVTEWPWRDPPRHAKCEDGNCATSWGAHNSRSFTTAPECRQHAEHFAAYLWDTQWEYQRPSKVAHNLRTILAAHPEAGRGLALKQHVPVRINGGGAGGMLPREYRSLRDGPA